MKYFVKYLPVEGKCKRGEIGWSINNATCLYDEGLPEGYCKPVKLFLCTRDIQVGDKVYAEPDAVKLGESFIIHKLETLDGNYTIAEIEYFTKFPGNTREWPADNLWKVIGSVSPDAIWVKEGDQFEEEQIKRDILTKEYDSESDEVEYTHYHPKGTEVFKISKYEDFICEYSIKIRCPSCGIFH